ncbi:MAG: leucine-rich repeat domain-containing protein [Haliscomenobacteraceae bacterium CHB4]|nr:hypothetical protein [Saprospiraceae bacterium]MCE7926491.1 leucine-rich repeat domain-containing protein [Haliscomenobacteraceae bacterium CHB4]
MQQNELPPPTAEEIEQYQSWWEGLSLPWKTAFNEVTLRRTTSEKPPDDVLHHIWHSPAIRFAGPTAPFPNMTFELESMDGVLALNRMEIFVFAFQKIRSIEPVAQLPQIKSLFVFNNRLDTLNGVEALRDLQEIYFNVNEVRSLKPLEHLTNLHTIYCNHNRLESLEGIGPQHAGVLKNFFCLPNEHLPGPEVIRVERELGIRCMEV